MSIRLPEVHASQWNDLLAKVYAGRAINQAHPHASGAWNWSTDPRQPNAGISVATPIRWPQVLESGRVVARHLAGITYALYGVRGNTGGAYNAYGYFYVNPSLHQAVYNDKIAQINAHDQPVVGKPARITDVNVSYQQLANVLIARLNSAVPDLRVCHASCHTNCHNSRGRR